MKLINIFPLNNMEMEHSQYTHMFLTHMVEKYPLYEKIARECDGYKILDNSLIELGGSVDVNRVIDAAERIGANEIILPDVFKSSYETLNAIEQALTIIKNRYSEKRFALMAVAQGNSVESWTECYGELLSNSEIDVIGIPKVCTKLHPAGRAYFVNNLCNYEDKVHHLLGLWYSFTEFNDFNSRAMRSIRSCDTCHLGYLAKYNLSLYSTRPDGYTLDLENDTINYGSLIDEFNQFSKKLLVGDVRK